MKRFAFLVAFALLALTWPALAGEVLPAAVDASVTVVCKDSGGSGVVFTNGKTAFVWTAAHVVANAQRVAVAIDPATGQPAVSVRYSDVSVLRARFRDGRKVGEDMRYARVLRYSDHEQGGEDLALLVLYDPDFGGPGVTFSEDKEVPAAGTPVWHVGSMNGKRGMGSVSDGVFSAAGRLWSGDRPDETTEPVTYDQVTVSTLRGCSGGGVFLKKDGRCIGLLSGGLNAQTEAGSLIVPARRVRDFARRTKCQWAVSRETPVPGEDGLLECPVTDRTVPVPEAFRPLAVPKD